MIWIVWYITAVMLMMLTDALAADVTKIQHNVGGSFITSLFWPITIPIVIYAVWKKNKGFADET